MDFGTQFGVFMLLAVLIVLGRWLKGWGQRMAERRAERDAPDPAVERALEQEQLVLDDTPDGPVPFGYKTSWAAVKCGSPDEAINALQLSGRRAGWTTGLAAAMRGQGVFVSPCLDGYVLVIGQELRQVPPEAFAEVQQFASHRGSDYYSWALYRDGRKLREFAYESDRVMVDDGPLTSEEQALGFDALPRKYEGPESAERSDMRLPDEEDVLNIAAAWGIDPRFENQTYPPSVGWLCT